jgi:protein-L-isoaspartate(D-aspartate) O-methyltransferase
VVEGDAVTPSVVEAMRLVPREQFVPGANVALAYGNHPVDIGWDQTISQPAVVAQMTEALELTGHERVLEIGTGSGYQAAILSLLARVVFTIERVEPLATAAAARLDELGYANVHVRVGDGFDGWSEQAPFDRILVTAAPEHIPTPLLAQLREGGILVVPVGSQKETQRLLRLRKRDGHVQIDELGAVKFVPMLEGVRP